MKSGFVFDRGCFVLLAFCFACASREEKPDTGLLLGYGFGIDRATFVVRDLDSARNYFAEVLKFKMPLKEKFKNGSFEGTRVAQAQFPDGSGIELLGIKDAGTVKIRHPFLPAYLEGGEGVRLYSFSTSSATTSRDWLTSQGFQMDSLRSGRTSAEPIKGWDWDDGGPEWHSAGFDNASPPAHLPSFVEWTGFPYRELQDEWESVHTSWVRSYYGHPNGVVGLVALRILVGDLQASREEFKKMGLQELSADDPNSLVRFKIRHHQELQLIAPQSSGDSLASLLKSRGPGVLTMRFEVKNVKQTRDSIAKSISPLALRYDSTHGLLTVLKDFAYGVQLEFVNESKEQARLAQIYDYDDDAKLDTAASRHAATTYTKYCALCHGADRKGYAADFAPSLRSRSLMATTRSSNYLKHAITYGRNGTAMAGYARSQGGPMDDADIDLLIKWLQDESGVEKPVDISTATIKGDAALGQILYDANCVKCHGVKGEGVSAPALANPAFLATASDGFLRYAIAEGRDSTPMKSYKADFKPTELDALTAFLRSRASGWDAPKSVVVTEPLPEGYVLNPLNASPDFTLREGLYVSAEQLSKAIKDSVRLVILDARSKAAWHQTHIPGAISVPYYQEPDSLIKHLPKDSTWIVAYCACPHAASQRVVSTLKRFGYQHTAILDEGVLVWALRGYPVQFGMDNEAKK